MYMIINPGTGPVADSKEAAASSNITEFVADIIANHQISVLIERLPHADYGNGRYGFKLTVGSRSCEIQMPGLPLTQVRMNADSNPWLFPRLYVNGDSWLWTPDLAVAIARRALIGEPELS